MLICGSDNAVPVVRVNELLLALTFDSPVIVPLTEVSVTLLSPMVMPDVPPTTATAKLPLLVKLRLPPEKPAARLLTLFDAVSRVALPVPMSCSDGAVMAPVCVIAPPADTVSVPPLAIVDVPKLTAPIASMVAFEADTMLTVPKLLAGMEVSTMGLAAPAVSVVVPGTVQAPPSVMPAEFASVTTASCAVIVNAPSWLPACDSTTSKIPDFNVIGVVGCTHADAWVMAAFSVMLTALGVPAMAMGPSTFDALVSVMPEPALAETSRVVVPVVVQAPPAVVAWVMGAFSVTLTAPPVSVRLPMTLAVSVRVMELPLCAASVTGTPVSAQAVAPWVIGLFSVMATELGVPFAVEIEMLPSTLP